jgi:hypothetical protein
MLTGLLVLLIEELIMFLKRSKDLNLQDWDASSHSVLKAGIFVGLIHLIIAFLPIINFYITVVLGIVSLILLINVVIFLAGTLKLQNDIKCHQSIPQAKAFSSLEF